MFIASQINKYRVVPVVCLLLQLTELIRHSLSYF